MTKTKPRVKVKANKNNRKRKSLFANWQLWVMVLPLIIWLLLYAIKPLTGILVAFQKYSPFKGIDGSEFIGLQNFKNLMFGPARELFWRAFKNTVLLSAYGLFIGFPVPIILAIMMHEMRKQKIRSAIQTITYAPHFISEVVVCSLVITMLAMNTGLFNVLPEKIMGLFGADYKQIHFMADGKFFRMIYTLIGIWKDAGFNSIVFFAALCAVPEDLYEAARIDGASRLRQIWHVSLPGIINTVVVMLIIRVGNILNVGYERVLLLYKPGIYDVADILGTYVYRITILGNPDYGLSTAASLVNAVFGFVLVIITNKISKKYSEASLW